MTLASPNKEIGTSLPLVSVIDELAAKLIANGFEIHRLDQDRHWLVSLVTPSDPDGTGFYVIPTDNGPYVNLTPSDVHADDWHRAFLTALADATFGAAER